MLVGKTILEYIKLKQFSLSVKIFEEGVILYIFYWMLDIGVEADVEAAEVTERLAGEKAVTKEEITSDSPLMSTGKTGMMFKIWHKAEILTIMNLM